MEKKVRHAKLYKNYFLEFYRKLDNKTRDKVDWTIKVIEYHAIVPTDYFQRM